MSEPTILCDYCDCNEFDCAECGLPVDQCECTIIDVICHRCGEPAYSEETLDAEFDDEWGIGEAACRCDDSDGYLVCDVCHVYRTGFDKPWRWFDREPICICNVQGLKCDTCGVERDDRDAPWQWAKERSYYAYKCRHMDHRIEYPNGVVVYASSRRDRGRGEVPDFGLYLDSSWYPECLAYLLDWPDYNAPRQLLVATKAIIDVYNKAADGWWIELGCIGGHGRTGSALACLGVLAGIPASDVVSWVQRNYCAEAVEGREQLWFIEWFDAFVNRKPFPPKPSYVFDRKEWRYDNDYAVAPGEEPFIWESTIDIPRLDRPVIQPIRQPAEPRGGVVYRHVETRPAPKEEVEESEYAEQVERLFAEHGECIICGPLDQCVCENQADRKKQLTTSSS